MPPDTCADLRLTDHAPGSQTGPIGHTQRPVLLDRLQRQTAPRQRPPHSLLWQGMGSSSEPCPGDDITMANFSTMCHEFRPINQLYQFILSVNPPPPQPPKPPHRRLCPFSYFLKPLQTIRKRAIWMTRVAAATSRASRRGSFIKRSMMRRQKHSSRQTWRPFP